MTDENTRLPSDSELLPCQADRERAASIAPPGLREGILSGQMDGGKYVRAFTAHRNDASTLPGDSVVEAAKHDAWDELVNVDDRTSPEEYPDMCLITREELFDFMGRAALRDDVRECSGKMTLAFEQAGWLAVAQIAEDRGDHKTAEDARREVARIDTALSQGDEQPDTQELPLCSDLTPGQRKFMICRDEIQMGDDMAFGFDSLIARTKLRGALASIIADPDCCDASKAIARDALTYHADSANTEDMSCEQPDTDGLLYRHCAPPRTDRKAVLEEAAKVADRESVLASTGRSCSARSRRETADHIAQAIRALAQGAGK